MNLAQIFFVALWELAKLYQKAILRCLVYVSISMLAAFLAEVKGMTHLTRDGMDAFDWFVLSLGCILQGLIAFRAFIDSTVHQINGVAKTS